MKVVACDDEYYAIEGLKITCKNFDFIEQLSCFNNPYACLDFAKNNQVDVALLDIEMVGINGIELAKELKEINDKIEIIFTTSYTQYAYDAFQLSAYSYLLKPYSSEQLYTKLNEINLKIKKNDSKNIFIKTFGNFDLFVNGKIVRFSNAKAKEMLAVLVDKQGSSVSSGEIIASLFEDQEVTDSVKSYYRNIRVQLKKTLEENNCAQIINLEKGECNVIPQEFDCDFYKFLKGDKEAVKAFCGEYMTNYSWAEYTLGSIISKFEN